MIFKEILITDIWQQFLFGYGKTIDDILIAARNGTPADESYEIFVIVPQGMIGVIAAFVLSTSTNISDFICGIHGVKITKKIGLPIDNEYNWCKYK